MKNERGFTLVEMLVVLLIISILILVTIPNVTKYSQMIDEKGCSAYQQMLQGQVEAYKLEKHQYPTMEELISANYINKDNATCPDGSDVEITSSGEVVIKGSVTTNSTDD